MTGNDLRELMPQLEIFHINDFMATFAAPKAGNGAGSTGLACCCLLNGRMRRTFPKRLAHQTAL